MTARIELNDLDFAGHVRAGDFVVWGQACGEPLTLTARLMAQRHRIGPFTAFIGISLGDCPDPEHADIVRFMSFCGTGGNARLAGAGKLDILPVHYSQLPGSLSPRVDVLMLQLAQSPDGSRFSLAASCDYVAALIPAARLVIAEVNRQAPFTDAPVDAADIDIMVPADYPPASLPVPAATPADERIGEHVAALVEDGATLQLGLGSTPECVAARLGAHRDLGFHAGVMSDAAMALMQRGAITNARKPRDAGQSVTGGLLGSAQLLRWAHANDAVALRPVSHTHDLRLAASMPKFTAINSAIEVDLSGQANTEFAAGRYVGTIGGALDFSRAAHASQGGLAIIAMPSTLKKRDGTTISRIVSRLRGPASVGRADVGLVVTEHGVADLRGMTLGERARALAGIAAPEFRDELAAQAVTDN